MSKRELIDTGTDKRYVRRSDTGQFETSSGKDGRERSTVVSKNPGGGDGMSRSAASGTYVSVGHKKGGVPTAVRGSYSMPNGEKIVTVRRDIVDRAIGREKK